MPHFTNAEAIAFYEDHNRYMAQEVAADKRHEAVERAVSDSMGEGGEYYPFTSDHVREALGELCFADQAMFAAYLVICDRNPNDLDTRTHLADFIVDRVNDYWHQIAVFQAQEQYDKAGF